MKSVVQHEFNSYTSPEIIFHQKVEALKLNHSRFGQWQTDTILKDTDVLDKSFASRFNREQSVYVAYEYEENGLVWLSLDYSGGIQVTSAASTMKRAEEILEEHYAIFPKAEDKPEKEQTSVNFWSIGPHGPSSIRRRIVVPTWDEIQGNYTEDISISLTDLMTMKSGSDLSDGQLILWQGEPGTGKTYALRALARSWRKWCDFHYITDPEQFFGAQAQYMLSVILSESPSSISYDPWDDDGGEEEERWKLLILEDSGELLGIDAKQHVGQALSRLLNVVDGMIGQGLRLLVLVTTNEPLGKLHPAVARYGRCAQKLSFQPLTIEEATKWLENNKVVGADVPRSPKTAADLYGIKSGLQDESKSLIGFAA